MTVGFLFPGQGAQIEGMLRTLPEHAEVAKTMAEATEVLGVELDSLDTSQALTSTVNVQLGLLISGLATARVLMAEKVKCGAVAGMSVGAFAAAVVCGALSFADALRLVKLRGELMQTAFPSGYGMAAIIGLNEDRIEGLIERVRTNKDPLYIANVNAPGQIVVAGSDASLGAISTLALAQGAYRAERLDVSVPSHCPLLQPIADRLVQEMAAISLRTPVVPYISNRGARALSNPDAIRQDLATNVANTVRWYDSLEVLRELGIRLFLEMIPGHVSTQVASRFLPDVRAISVADRGIRYAIFVAARENGADV